MQTTHMCEQRFVSSAGPWEEGPWVPTAQLTGGAERRPPAPPGLLPLPVLHCQHCPLCTLPLQPPLPSPEEFLLSLGEIFLPKDTPLLTQVFPLRAQVSVKHKQEALLSLLGYALHPGHSHQANLNRKRGTEENSRRARDNFTAPKYHPAPLFGSSILRFQITDLKGSFGYAGVLKCLSKDPDAKRYLRGE